VKGLACAGPFCVSGGTRGGVSRPSR